MTNEEVDRRTAIEAMERLESGNPKESGGTYWEDESGPITLTKNWHPTSSIEQAWAVVEKILGNVAKCDSVDISFSAESVVDNERYKCFVTFCTIEHSDYWATAETAPLAICLAALKAIEEA